MLCRPRLTAALTAALVLVTGTAVALQVGGLPSNNEDPPPPEEPPQNVVEPYELPCGTAATFTLPKVYDHLPIVPAAGWGWAATPSEASANALEELHAELVYRRKINCGPCFDGCEPIVLNLNYDELFFFTEFVIDPLYGEGFVTMAFYGDVVFDVWCTECLD